MSSQKDSSPNMGSKGGGLKNDDARMNKGYDKQHKAPFNPKLTFAPNEDAPQLPQQEGLQDGAY